MNLHTHPPFIVGLTGGIASGKTQASQYFSALGIEVVDADVIAREIVAPGSGILEQLVKHFGKPILHPDGTLDRARLRKQVFNDERQRQALNHIMHPAIAAELHRRCHMARSEYVIAAIALLAEAGGRSGQYSWLQRIVLVDAEQSMQHARLCQRDGIDSVLAWQMIHAQAPRALRQALADEIIVNDDTLDRLHAQVKSVDHFYRKLAKAYHSTMKQQHPR